MDGKLIALFVAEISENLRARLDSEISGAQLGEFITGNVKGPSVREIVNIPAGPGALTKFINIYLADVLSRKRKQGVDWIYKIHHHSNRKPHELNHSAWFVFEVKQFSHSLFVNLSAQTVSVERVEDVSLIDDCKIINSVAGDEKEQIKSNFLIKLQYEISQLGIEVDLSQKKFSGGWISYLRSRSQGLYEKWLQFYKESIIGIFEQRLEVAGITAMNVSRILKEFEAAYLSEDKFISAHYGQNIKLSDKILEADFVGVSDEVFRASFASVIAKMSVAELRKISLPFGMVFDALHRTKN